MSTYHNIPRSKLRMDLVSFCPDHQPLEYFLSHLVPPVWFANQQQLTVRTLVGYSRHQPVASFTENWRKKMKWFYVFIIENGQCYWIEFISFSFTKYFICSAVPLLVALVIDHAASFRVLNSSFFSMWIKTGNICASITAWICCRFPAVIFDIVQDASFRIDSFSDDSRCKIWGNAPLFNITWVWTSSPVTILPTARSAALTMLCESCLLDANLKETFIFCY